MPNPIDPGMSVGQDPSALQSLLQMIAGQGGQPNVFGQRPNQAGIGVPQPQSPAISPARIGMAGAPGMPGGNVPMTMPSISSGMGGPPGVTPNMTASGISGPPQLQGPVGYGGPTEWSTRSSKRMALTQMAVQGVTQLANQNRQQRWNQTAAGAEQQWQKYHDALQQVSDDKTAVQNNPFDKSAQAKLQRDQQALQNIQGDKDFKKIIDKATKDPTSPEGVGMQRAMAQAKQEAMDQFTMEQKMAQAQAEIARAQAEQARAAAQQSVADVNRIKAQQIGQVTPALQAQIDARQKVAETQAQAHVDATKITAQAVSERNQINQQLRSQQLADLQAARADTATTNKYKAESADLAKQEALLQKQQAAIQNELNKIPPGLKMMHALGYKHDKTLQKQIDAFQANIDATKKKQDKLTDDYNTAMAKSQAARQERASRPAPQLSAPPAAPADTGGTGSPSNVDDLTGDTTEATNPPD